MHVLIDIHVSKYFIFLHLVLIMYLIPYSMLLNHIAIQNYSKFKIFLIKICFRPYGRPGGRPHLFQALTIDRPGRPGLGALACTFVHVCRSTDWLTLALGFCRSTGPVDRQNKELFLFCFRSIDRSTVSNGCQLDCRSTGPVDRQPPTASFLRFIFWIWLRCLCQLSLNFWRLILDL